MRGLRDRSGYGALLCNDATPHNLILRIRLKPSRFSLLTTRTAFPVDAISSPIVFGPVRDDQVVFSFSSVWSRRPSKFASILISTLSPFSAST